MHIVYLFLVLFFCQNSLSKEISKEDLFLENYNKNYVPASEVLDLKDFKIPKIIHQIWLGGNMPEIYKKYAESFKILLPDWEYKLWTEENISELNMLNFALFKKVKNFGEKSDILRYEILLKYGGVYADCDIQCLNPKMFEYLNKAYDFYIGLQPKDVGHVTVGTGVIGSSKNHPILRAVVEGLRAQYDPKTPIFSRTGPLYFTKIFLKYSDYTSSFRKLKNIALPSKYFYPIGITQKHLSFQEASAYFSPETCTMHYWAGSWQKK